MLLKITYVCRWYYSTKCSSEGQCIGKWLAICSYKFVFVHKIITRSNRYYYRVVLLSVHTTFFAGILTSHRTCPSVQCLNWGVEVVEPLTVFSTPLTHCQIMYWGGRQLYTIYIRFTSQFWFGSNRWNVHPPTDFSQFKHCYRLFVPYGFKSLIIAWKRKSAGKLKLVPEFLRTSVTSANIWLKGAVAQWHNMAALGLYTFTDHRFTEVTAVLFSARSPSCFLISADMITHELLHSAWWNFAWTSCRPTSTLRASRLEL